MVSKVFLTLFNEGKLGPFIFDNVYDANVVSCIVTSKYLPAVLNTQGTPLHWKHLNNRRLEGIRYDSKEKHEYNLKDFQPKRRKLPNDSDMLYIE
ncbi:short integuments 2 [Quercus suber]|uniref:Short integuments 2 n=1 Tax=Quercus suber TaxID=58331 RepID=A0AAW0K790_QUESU